MVESCCTDHRSYFYRETRDVHFTCVPLHIRDAASYLLGIILRFAPVTLITFPNNSGLHISKTIIVQQSLLHDEDGIPIRIG